MSAVRASRNWLRADRGATGAEFAIVLPLALIFLLGIVDAGRYMYTINQAQKAVQVGARWAAVTDIMPITLKDYSFVATGQVTQGDPVGTDIFTAYECTSDGSAVTCACESGGTCDFDLTTDTDDNDSFGVMYTRMEQMLPGLTEDQIVVRYSNSGLGYAGDPTGPDIAPFVTVSIDDLSFIPTSLMLFNATVPLPDFSHTVTLEDGQGSGSN